MKKFLVLFLLVTTVGFSQNWNGYKYAMVPAKFSFLKEENQYNLNLLTTMYLQKYGFETYYNSESAPDEFVNSNCNKIYIDVLENNNMFTTKLKVVVKDCKGTVLATSEEGTSRDKEYRVAYNEALRMAFDNFRILKTHKFQPTNIIIETPKAEVGEMSSEDLNRKLTVVKIENGFDLYTNENKLLLSAKNTSVRNVFIAVAGIESGVLQKGKDDLWYFEYYREGSKKLISENLFFNL